MPPSLVLPAWAPTRPQDPPGGCVEGGARAAGAVSGKGRAAALRDVTHPQGSPCSGARAGGEAAAVRPASICVGAFTPWDGLRWAPSAPNGDGRGGSLCRAPAPGCGKDAAPLCPPPPPTPGKPRVWLRPGSRQPLELCGEGEARAGVGQRGRGSTIRARRAAAAPLAALGAVGVPAEGAPGQRFLLLSCFPCGGFLLDPGRSVSCRVVGRRTLGWGRGPGWLGGARARRSPPGLAEVVGSWGWSRFPGVPSSVGGRMGAGALSQFQLGGRELGGQEGAALGEGSHRTPGDGVE